MRHTTTTINGRHGNPVVEAAAFWIFGVIIMVIAFGDAVALLAVAIGIVTTISWIYRKVEHRGARSDVEVAPVTHLRTELTGQRDLKENSAHASWRGPRAA